LPPSGYRYYTRRWLNRPGYHAGAYVIGCIDASTIHEHTSSGSLTIADCSRLIRLEFDTFSPDSRKNALYKTDVLIKTLTEMRAELIAPERRRRGRA
jgi:hypothetical protein